MRRCKFALLLIFSFIIILKVSFILRHVFFMLSYVQDGFEADTWARQNGQYNILGYLSSRPSGLEKKSRGYEVSCFWVWVLCIVCSLAFTLSILHQGRSLQQVALLTIAVAFSFFYFLTVEWCYSIVVRSYRGPR